MSYQANSNDNSARQYKRVDQISTIVDNRVYGSNQRPAKYDLIREEPRNRGHSMQTQIQSQMNMNPIQFDALGNDRSTAHAQGPTQQQNHSTVYYPPSLAQARLQSYQKTSKSDRELNRPVPPPRNYNNLNDNTSTSDYGLPELNLLTNELAQKEAKLRREIAYMNTYKNSFQPKSTWDPRREPDAQSAPSAKSHKLWHKEVPQSPFGSRPASRASSARSATTEADILEKTAKLLEDAKELERKEIIDEPVLLDPRGEQRPASGTGSPANSLGRQRSGVKSAIITVPSRQIDNKSPLPFSYDNFSTLGVRGNIASVGAAKPDKPYPPIFPQLKRTQSPF